MLRGTGIAALAALCLWPGASSAAPAGCKIEYQAVPVTLEDQQPMLDASIDGHKIRFVVDSGAFFSFITPGTAAALDLKPHSAPYGLRVEGFGGSFEPSVVTAPSLDVVGSTFHRVDFLTTGNETGQGSAGLLGQNFLHSFDVEYDLPNGMIRLMRKQGCKGDLFLWPSKTGFGAVDLVVFGNGVWATTTYVQVNGQRLKAMFDTGAGESFITIAAARRIGFDPKGQAVEPAGTVMGVGRRLVRSWIMPVDSFKIGDEEVKHTRLRVGDSAIGDIDMLIGPDFFLSHHIFVDNDRKRIIFSYNGGPVFDLRTDPDAPHAPAPAVAGDAPPAGQKGLFASEPTDADGFARRGAAHTERKDYAGAIADLTRAHDLAPKEGRYLFLRAIAYLHNQQPFLAVGDLDAAIVLAPDDADARIARAQVRLGGDDFIGAVGDLDAADKALPVQDDRRLEMGAIYDRARSWDKAQRQVELWIKAHPEDARLAEALNGRCRIGAMSGADLDEALKACDAAIRRQPRSAGFLDSRGLVHLRRGETDKALADYDAALALDPKLVWSLYGRSLAEQKKGLANKARADRAAALALDPKIARKASDAGVAG